MNGTPPSVVANKIKTVSSEMTERKVNDLPRINFVRKCRVFVQNLNSTLAALRLVDADEWHQIFTDETPRRQIDFHNLVIAVMVD